METIRIKYLRNIKKIERFNVGDYIDLRAAEDITMKKGQSALIPLGVAMELPQGYEAMVVPRSSTFKRLGILMSNSI